MFFFFPGLDLFGALIFKEDLLVEICLDEIESFLDGLEEDFIKFRDRRARAQRFEQLPWIDWSHINHWGG